jgi:hypothetical protein
MKRATSLAYLGAIVLVSHALLACATEYTVTDEDPATDVQAAVADTRPPIVPDDVAVGPDGRPPRQLIDAPSADALLARWQLPSTSPWLPYEKLMLPSVLAAEPTPLWMPEVERLEEVSLARIAARQVARDGLPRDAAWFVELSGAASIAFAATLAEWSSTTIAAIPTFNNWPANEELVPAEETLAAMIAFPPRLPQPGDVGAIPVFLLDSWRLAFKYETIDDGVVDNRYMLGAADFPSAAVLRAQGIAKVIYLVDGDDYLEEEDDLNNLFADYEESGIALYVVDVWSIVRPRAVWDTTWYGRGLLRHIHVRQRDTVVNDPRFYGRSRGGFGGTQLTPTPSGHMHIGSHGGG